MVKKLFHCLIIPLILSSPERSHAAKEHIFNFDDYETELDRQSQATADLTSKCLLSEVKPLCIGEKLNDDSFSQFLQSATTSVVSLARSQLVDERYSASMTGKSIASKSEGFLLSASSPADLKDELDFVKSSQWWNSAGLFIFAEADDAVGERCSYAYDFLSLAWRYGLLSSVFLCQEQDGFVSLYSYNPYGTWAPQPWLMVRETKGKNGHPWHMFKWKKYDGHGRSCETIFFDKTKALEGYPIDTNALSASALLYVNKSGNGLEKYKGEDGTTMKEIWKYLNGSIVDVPLPDQDAFLGWMDDNGTFHGHLKDIASGKVEIGLNSNMLEPIRKVTPAYSHSTSRLCFVVKDRGAMPWLIGLALIFDGPTMVSAIVVFLLSALIFGFLDRRRYFSGCMNTYRMFLSVSFFRPPRSTHLRIILCFVYLYPIVCYSTLQGKILSLLQHPLRYTNVETFEDLRREGFKIIGPKTMTDFLPAEKLGNLTVTQDFDSCLKKLYNNELVGCLNYCTSLAVMASHQENLHIADQISRRFYSIYIAKPDWPLIDRFNKVVSRFFEAGLIDHFRRASMYENLKTSSLYPDDSSDTSPVQVITLKDFRYVFMGVAIGWALASVAFVGELLVNRLKKLKVFRI